MAQSASLIKNGINRQLHNLANYWDAIPLGEIFQIVSLAGRVLQEDGTPWDGLLCGEEGDAHFDIENVKYRLHVMWYKMPSGRYEIVAYVS